MRRRDCLASFLLCLGPTPVFAQEQGASLNQQLEATRSDHGLPALAAAVVRQGEIVAAGAAGVRVYGRDEKVTINDRFHLGSDTKAMTATLAGMLVDEGKLRWSSTIGEVIGSEILGLRPRLAEVTLEQLLSHSGGISPDDPEILKLYFSPDNFHYEMPEMRIRAIRTLKLHALRTPPGLGFHYANLGYMIAGAMIEKAAGISWEEFITSRLYAPLKLTTAGLGPQATTGKFDAAVGHNLDDAGNITPMPWGPAADIPPLIGPAGAAHMSVLDFARWASWNASNGKRGPALVKPETLVEIHRPRISTGKLPNARPGTPQEGEYALGWGLVKFGWTEKPVLTHNGSNSMNFAKILVDKNKDVAIVLTTNIAGQRAEDALSKLQETLYRKYALTEA
jgi:CubicO group peptidase (beta-lactamase class C family)